MAAVAMEKDDADAGGSISNTTNKREATLPCDKKIPPSSSSSSSATAIARENKAREFVERVIRLQAETCYGGAASTKDDDDHVPEETKQQQKQVFLHFVRILQKHLEQKEPETHLKVKATLQQCAVRRKQGEAGYETVAASMASTHVCLQKLVRPALWKRAIDDVKQQYANSNVVWTQIDSFAMEDMIFFASRLMEKQDEFAAAAAKNDDDDDDNSSYQLHVDIGVHYTKYSNMNRIQVNGLLSRNDRVKIGILADRFNGAVHGDGIYTGNNPYAFCDFGDVGILVARLYGKVLRRQSSDAKKQATPQEIDACNSIVVGDDDYSQIVVLNQSSQCIPLLHYPRSMVDRQNQESSTSPANRAIHYYQEELQRIVDEFFNGGIRSSSSRVSSGDGRGDESRKEHQQIASRTTSSPINQGRQPANKMTTTMNVFMHSLYQIVYSLVFMAIVGTIISMSLSACLFMVKIMS